MKKTLLLLYFISAGLFAYAQPDFDTLNENFNTCDVVNHAPPYWVTYNPITATDPQGKWACTATNGRYGTPGIECTGYYDGVFHLDTSYLITPNIVSLYTHFPGTGSLYLHFDTKTTYFTLGSRLAVLATTDTPNYLLGLFSRTVFPAFGTGDTVNWVTHEVDITPYKDSANSRFAFRYDAATSRGSIWYLDNVNITGWALSVPQTFIDNLPLTIIGNSTTEEISVAVDSRKQEAYDLAIYDLMGREVHKEPLNALTGIRTYHIRGLSLLPGMYFVKIGNGNSFGTVKTIVQ